MNFSRHFASTIAILSVFGISTVALAQGAPAGNSYPQAELLESGDYPNPLGTPTTPDEMSSEQKYEFSKSVDLSPLRAAAVHHNGRVKILDTLARETVRAITGRRDYIDIIPITNDAGVVTKVRKLHYDPLFTYLDLLASSSYYFNKPLVHVTYLPARRALIEATISDPKMEERWMKLTRLSPGMIGAAFRTVAEEQGTDAAVADELSKLSSISDLLRRGHANLLMVAPQTEGGDWLHVSALSKDTPLRKAFAQLGDAWRAGDADRVNSSIITVAAELEAVNAGRDHPTRRAIEAGYNRAHPFDVGAWLYLVSFLSLLLAFGTSWRWTLILGVTTLSLAVLAHAAGFGARWWIAERLPIQNQFESMTGLALGGAVAGLVIMLMKRQWLFGAAAAAVGFLILTAATQTSVPGETIGREAAILNTSWLLKYHVTTVLVGYGLITLSAVMSSFYLALHYFGAKGGDPSPGFAAQGLGLLKPGSADEATQQVNLGRSRLLKDLDNAQMTVLQLAFWVLGVGVMLGAWWADHSWGRWWAFDPKETWALLTWIIYLVVIHVRHGLKTKKGLVTAWLSVVGFFVMLWTYFGVNLLLPGLHAYA